MAYARVLVAHPQVPTTQFPTFRAPLRVPCARSHVRADHVNWLLEDTAQRNVDSLEIVHEAFESMFRYPGAEMDMLDDAQIKALGSADTRLQMPPATVHYLIAYGAVVAINRIVSRGEGRYVFITIGRDATYEHVVQLGGPKSSPPLPVPLPAPMPAPAPPPAATGDDDVNPDKKVPAPPPLVGPSARAHDHGSSSAGGTAGGRCRCRSPRRPSVPTATCSSWTRSPRSCARAGRPWKIFESRARVAAVPPPVRCVYIDHSLMLPVTLSMTGGSTAESTEVTRAVTRVITEENMFFTPEDTASFAPSLACVAACRAPVRTALLRRSVKVGNDDEAGRGVEGVGVMSSSMASRARAPF